MLRRSLIRDIPDPTPLLFGLAVVAASAVWFVDGGPVQVFMLALVALPLVGAVAYSLGANVYLTTICVIVASAVPRAFIEISNLKARPEHLLPGLLILALPWLWNAREGKIEWTRADLLLVAYMAANLISSWFMSPDPKQTTKWALQQVLAISPYFILRIVAGREDTFLRAFRVLLIVSALEAVYAVIATYSNLLFGSTFGLSLDQYEGIPAVYGTQYEPNFLGSYCAAATVMMAAMYLKQPKKWYLVGYAITLAGMAVASSRAALLASLAVMLLLLIAGIRKNWVNGSMLRRLALATGVVVVVLAPIQFHAYAERFSTVEVSDVTADPNTFTRAVQLAMGLDQFMDHPVLGNGTASFQLLFNWTDLGPDWEEQGWLGNTEVRVLHDTGLVGFTLFAAFLISLALAVYRRFRREFPAEVVALVAACLIYLLTFQTTEGTILAFTWVHLGLLACAVAAYSGAARGISSLTPQG